MVVMSMLVLNLILGAMIIGAFGLLISIILLIVFKVKKFKKRYYLIPLIMGILSFLMFIPIAVVMILSKFV